MTTHSRDLKRQQADGKGGWARSGLRLRPTGDLTTADYEMHPHTLHILYQQTVEILPPKEEKSSGASGPHARPKTVSRLDHTQEPLMGCVRDFPRFGISTRSAARDCPLASQAP